MGSEEHSEAILYYRNLVMKKLKEHFVHKDGIWLVPFSHLNADAVRVEVWIDDKRVNEQAKLIEEKYKSELALEQNKAKLNQEKQISELKTIFIFLFIYIIPLIILYKNAKTKPIPKNNSPFFITLFIHTGTFPTTCFV